MPTSIYDNIYKIEYLHFQTSNSVPQKYYRCQHTFLTFVALINYRRPKISNKKKTTEAVISGSYKRNI